MYFFHFLGDLMLFLNIFEGLGFDYFELIMFILLSFLNQAAPA